MERKEAIEVIKKNWPDSSFTMLREALETLIPELKKPNDEMILGALAELVHDTTGDSLWVDYGVHKEDVIDWLYRQGEYAYFKDNIQIGDRVTRNEDGVLVNLSQLNRVAKPSDKVEPEFEIGDLITNGILVGKIDEIHEWGYHAYFGDHYADVPDAENWHKWTIQDARDCDILACNKEILLFKSYSVQGRISLYCWYNGQTNNFHSKEVNDTSITTRNKIYPATKEQRDTLEKAMADAGWEFDFKKKKLKKIEQCPAEEYSFNIESELFHQLTKEQQGLWKKEIKQAYNAGADTQKLTKWSEEDERMYINLHNLIYSAPYCDSRKELYNWLKFLKNKVQSQLQPKQEWSKEDERIYQSIIDDTVQENQLDNKQIDWLKSLRHQNTWKPSEEQMEALDDVISSRDIKYDVLSELWKDLKKLREE